MPHGGLIGQADADARGSTRPVQRPAPFDGRTTLDAYRTQFELLAEINRWNEVEKATFLAISLKGPALTVLSNLSAESRRDYPALVAALESRFGSAHQAELNRMQLRSRTRRREESLPELAEDVDRLCRLAYPGAAPAMLELLAKDQFVDALTDEDMRLRIRQNRPETLRGALEAALQLESYQLASKQKCKTVREVHIEHSREPKRNFQKLGNQVTNCDDLVQDLQELKKQVTALKQALRRKTPGRQNNLERVICWRCRKRGHYKRDCTWERRRPKRLATNFKAPIVTEVYKTGTIFGPCNSVWAHGTIQGKDCRITIDTGSNISIVRPDVLQRGTKTSIQPVSSCLRTVTGEKAPIHGKSDLQVGIGTLVIPHQRILGLDFLEHHGCQVDLKQGILLVAEEEVPLQQQRKIQSPPAAESLHRTR